jgi:2-aminoadipate transaminase
LSAVAEPPYAARVRGITGSVIDSSTSLLARQTHDIVRFAMGSPAPEAVPAAEFGELAAELLGAAHADAYDYGATEGEPVLRAALRAFLAGQDGGAPADDRLLITAGGMQGLDLACKLFVEPGEPVVVESPTYTNGTAVITSYGGRVLEVPIDGDGMVVEALPDLVAAAGATPRLIYVIPQFQNPSGASLSLPRRHRLLELAAEWGSVILEDDPYGLLRFAGDAVPTLEELNDGSVCVVGVRTFSKFLAPGLRVGWTTADPAVVARMVDAKQGLDTCTNVPMQRVVAAFLERGMLDRHLDRLRAEYRERKVVMQRSLQRHLGDVEARWTDPDGGFFLWLTLAADVDTQALFEIALAEGVAYIPGPAFSPSGRFTNALRLCFASTAAERTDLGVRRLRSALDRLNSTAPHRGAIPPR